MNDFKLPFEFNEIINYSNLYNLESTITGYTYDTKTKKTKIDISNLHDYNNINNEDELVDIFYKAKETVKEVSNIKNDLNRLKQENEELKSKINQGELNANRIRIKAGVSGTTLIDSNGITSFNKNEPNRMIRITHDAIGISTNGDNDFEPIITSDGINPRYLPSIVQPKVNLNNNIEKIISDTDVKGNGNSNNENSNGGNNGTSSDVINNVTNNTYINNPKIRYEDLPCKIFRNPKTKKVEKIEYYKDGNLEYIETFNRDEQGKKVINIVLEHVDKEIETTEIIRNTEGKVDEINVQYENLDTNTEYVGMK